MAGHAGARLLADLSEATGLTTAYSTTLRPLQPCGTGYDPGPTATDLAVMLADGGQAIADLAVLRDQAGVNRSSRRDEWIRLGVFAELKRIALDAYDRIVGLVLDRIAVDGAITKAPGGGEVAGRSPVDRDKQGLKRSGMTDGYGIPLGRVLAGANRHDSPLLAPSLDRLNNLEPLPQDMTVYWDAGTARLLPRLLRGRTRGPVFVTHRRPGPGKVVSPRDVCPDTGLARLSYGQARALLDEHTAVRGPGTGWDLHEYRHSALTHLGEQGASLLMLMAKSRHKKPENVRRYFKPSHEAISELTSLLAPGDSRR